MDNKVYLCFINNINDFTNNKDTYIFQNLESAREFSGSKCNIHIGNNRDGDYVYTTTCTAKIYRVNYGEAIDKNKPYEYVYKSKEDFTIKFTKCTN